MAHHTISGMEETAVFLLDILLDGTDVTLDIAAEDRAQQGMVQLITALHDAATRQRVGIVLTTVDEQSVRLTLVDRM